jgi:hypothetical protein
LVFFILVLPFSPSIGAIFTNFFPLVLVLSLGELNRVQSCKQRGPETTPLGIILSCKADSCYAGHGAVGLTTPSTRTVSGLTSGIWVNGTVWAQKMVSALSQKLHRETRPSSKRRDSHSPV